MEVIIILVKIFVVIFACAQGISLYYKMKGQ